MVARNAKLRYPNPNRNYNIDLQEFNKQLKHLCISVGKHTVVHKCVWRTLVRDWLLCK